MRSRESMSTHYPQACHQSPPYTRPHICVSRGQGDNALTVILLCIQFASFISFKVQEGQAGDLTNPEHLNSQLWQVDSEPKRGTIPVETGTFSQ